MYKFLLFLAVLCASEHLLAEDAHWVFDKQPLGHVVWSFMVTQDGELWAHHNIDILQCRDRDNWDTLNNSIEFSYGSAQNPRGEVFATNGQGGMGQSDDNGKSWKVIEGMGTRQIVINAEGVIFAAGNNDVYVSKDNGKSWRRSVEMVDAVDALALSPKGDVYAGCYVSDIVLHSANNGRNWDTLMNADDPVGVVRDIHSNRYGVFIGTSFGLFRSDENGKNFTKISPFSTSKRMNIDSAQNIYMHGSGGVHRSSDGGKTWQDWGEIYLVYSFITTPDGYTYCGTMAGAMYRSIERSIDHPVVWGTVQSCDEARFVVMDDSLVSVDFVQSSSSNVSLTVDGSFPSAKVKVKVKLIDPTKEGTYTLYAKNIQGKDLVYTAHLSTFTDKPTIEQSYDTLWASGGYIFQWYKNGQKLESEEKEYYVPKTEGKYTVTAMYAHGCITESLPFSFTFTGVAEKDHKQEAEGNQNVPNPFSERTTILYRLSHSGFVRLVVTDALGRTIAVLVDGVQEAGGHRAELNAQALSTGVYYYRLETAEGIISRQMMIMK